VELNGSIAARLSRPGGGLLLDLDGTLVQSEAVHQRALRDYFVARGWQVADDVVREFSGRRAREVFRVLDGPWTGEDPAAVAEDVLEVLRGMAVRPEPVPGATRLLAACATIGLPMAVVTSAQREWVAAALELLGAAEFGVRTVTAEDCTHGKPDPEPFRRGAELLGLDPSGLVAVEDSPAGIASACAAGVGYVIGLTTSRPAHALRAAGARETSADLTALTTTVERQALHRGTASM